MRDKNREEGTESEREHERGGRRAAVRGMRQECPIESRLLENAWPPLLTPSPEMHNVRRSRDYRKSATISSSFTHTDTVETRTYETANNIRITEIYRACSLRSRPCGGLCRNRSFVTHQVLGQEMHYR
ncbi:hypothetical protein DPX16_12102 [Anabarilius grahami]|uniref:Uncharacterized protein n=1 Tax=Anabarilius grahami TaxID=495550 RepID=A0A3N0YYZ9_ANAGA|nr:hypothetical protein DPX16_12102 [Anabarilius grahami]